MIHEAPDSRVGAVDDTFEAIVPPFRQVGGSRKSADGGIPLVPYKLVEEEIRGRCPKPGVIHVSREDRHVRKDEREGTNHLEGLPHL